MDIGFEFDDFDYENESYERSSFYVFTDTAKLAVSWSKGWPDEVLLYAPYSRRAGEVKNESDESFIALDALEHVYVMVKKEPVSLKALFDYIRGALEDFIEDERAEYLAELSMTDELSSAYWTGRI